MKPFDLHGLQPPVLDLEWNNHSSCKNKFNKEDILEKVRRARAVLDKIASE